MAQYICEKCRFAFTRTGEVDACPDCGSGNIRIAPELDPDVQKRLAESLTAESTEIIPFLPYLLQDFWSLASDPGEMIDVLRAHTDFGPGARLLDLACGKGVASVCLAREFGCTAKGIDLIPDFIAQAGEKAAEYGVAERCTFVVGDVGDAVETERAFDLTVWGGSGDLLGGYPKTLAGIARTVKPGGYILIDDGYIPHERQRLRFGHDYLTKAQWEQAFRDNGLVVVSCKEEEPVVDPSVYADDLQNIRRRAEELVLRHPDKRALFEGYVKSQQAEYEDLQDGMIPAMWLLQKVM